MKNIQNQPTLFGDIPMPRVSSEPFDVCARKSRYNEQSADAFKSADTATRRVEIVEFVMKSGNATAKEFGKAKNLPFHSYSGRFSECRAWGILRTIPLDSAGERVVVRDKSAALALTERFQQALDLKHAQTGRRDIKSVIDDFKRSYEQIENRKSF